MDPMFLDDIDCETFFELLDDLVDLPSENECILDEIMPLDDPIFLSDNRPEDALTFMEDSYADGGMSITKDDNCTNKETSHNQSRNSSPVSVLESSGSRSSCSGGRTLPLSPSPRGTQRARSKRPRPPKFSPRTPIQHISSSTLFGENQPPEVKHSPPAQGVRKCTHCEMTKTPQWRAGPMGKKTLCNACGVRYKSGRLVPEYRPAASPTFIPSVHSNSHKKVIQMQIKSAKGSTSFLYQSPSDAMEGSGSSR